jgi:quercetin dioxygenase-like cupin family protein
MAGGYVISEDQGARFEPAPGATLRMVNGAEHGLGDVGFIISEYPPGAANAEHRHTFASAIVVVEGDGLFTVDEDELRASRGDIVVVPAGSWHSFGNNGEGPLRVGVDLGSGVHATEMRPAPSEYEA